MESNRKLSTQYSIYKESLIEMRADTFAWKLFQEILPPDVNLFTVQISGDAEPDAAQCALIDCYFESYRKKRNGMAANGGEPSGGKGTELEEMVKRVVEAINTHSVKAVDEVPVQQMQVNRFPVNQPTVYQRGPYLAQPSYYQGGQQGGDGRGRSFGETRRCYVCGRVGHLARDCRSARNGNVNRGIEYENTYNRNNNNRYGTGNNSNNMNNGYRWDGNDRNNVYRPQAGCERSWRTNAASPKLIRVVPVAAM